MLHAITFVDRIVESTETLLTNSRIGRIVPEFNQQDRRDVIVANHRIVYPVKDKDGDVYIPMLSKARETCWLSSAENLGT